ncbi:MAG TPA: hypothetical protein VGK30_06385 [Candidatus Binatia bacterium]|jgi:hypothetical protein
MSTTSTASSSASAALSEPSELVVYRHALRTLNAAGAPYLVGGAYAFAHYTGVHRHTKDFDIFVRPTERDVILSVLADAGYRTEVTFTHWLGKAFAGDVLIDVIFSSGNGLCVVDDEWFRHARRAELLGVPVLLSPPEEMIWSKAFIMERERYDGADINHLLHACGAGLDWKRLLARFDTHWPVLLSHLVLFAFAYPNARDRVPAWVLADLLRAAIAENAVAPAGVCRGTLLSRQYLHDVRRHGYRDARLEGGGMTPDELAQWTQAFEVDDLGKRTGSRSK